MRQLLVLVLVAVTAAAQGVGISFLGTKPDVVLIVLLALAAKADFLLVLLCAAVALFVLKPGPAADFPLTLLVLAPLAASFLRRILPWHEWITYALFVFLATVGLYLVSHAELLLTRGFFEELFINLLVGSFFFALFLWAWHHA